MEGRHLIAGVIVLLGVVIIAIALAFGIMQYYPQLIGMDKEGNMLKTSKSDEETLQEEPTDLLQDMENEIRTVSTVNVTLDKIERYEYELQYKNKLVSEKDSLVNISQSLMDSISTIFSETSLLLDSVNKMQKNYGKYEKRVKKLKDSINTINTALKTKDAKIKELDKEVDFQKSLVQNEMDTIDAVHYRELAKIYNNSKPAEVALILEQLNEKKAAIILRLMRKKNAGQVIDAMNPEVAAAIQILGATPLPMEIENE